MAVLYKLWIPDGKAETDITFSRLPFGAYTNVWSKVLQVFPCGRTVTVCTLALYLLLYTAGSSGICKEDGTTGACRCLC